MPRKPRQLEDNSIYHIYNRGNDRALHPFILQSVSRIFWCLGCYFYPAIA